jgi:hypothetical protein
MCVYHAQFAHRSQGGSPGTPDTVTEPKKVNSCFRLLG